MRSGIVADDIVLQAGEGRRELVGSDEILKIKPVPPFFEISGSPVRGDAETDRRAR